MCMKDWTTLHVKLSAHALCALNNYRGHGSTTDYLAYTFSADLWFSRVPSYGPARDFLVSGNAVQPLFGRFLRLVLDVLFHHAHQLQADGVHVFLGRVHADHFLVVVGGCGVVAHCGHLGSRGAELSGPHQRLDVFPGLVDPTGVSEDQPFTVSGLPLRRHGLRRFDAYVAPVHHLRRLEIVLVFALVLGL